MTRTLTDEESGSAIGNPKSVIAVLFFLLFLGVSDAQMLSPLLSQIAKEFDVTVGEAGKLLNGVYAFAAAIAALVIGSLSDRYGRRRFLVTAVAVFALSLLLAAFVTDLRLLVVLRSLTGFAAGIFSLCAIVCIGDYFPYEKRGAAMSAVQAGYFVALVAGVPLGSWLADLQGWRASYVCLGLLATPIIFLFRVMPNDGKRVVKDQSPGHKRIGFPLVSRAQYAAIGAAFFVSLGFAGFVQYLGSWLTDPRGLALRTKDVGLFFIAFGVAALCGSIGAFYFSDKIGKQRLSLICTLLIALLLLAIPQLSLGLVLYIAFATASFIYALRQGPLQALATELVSQEVRGSLISMRNVASQIGIVFTSVICGQLYNAYGYIAVGLFSAAATLVAIICISLMREPERVVFGEVNL